MDDQDEIDYESLPDNFSFSAHMLAGAMAGIAEHGLTYPLDSIKTRMQVLSSTVEPSASSSSSALMNTIRQIRITEGSQSLWRGIGSMILGSGPAHALYFATYEESKRFLLQSPHFQSMNPAICAGIAGGLGTIVADAFMNPFDVIKQRMQIGYASLGTCSKPLTSGCTESAMKPAVDCKISSTTSSALNVMRYRSLMHCFRHTMSTEGLAAFYVSYPTTLAISIPFQTVNFAMYEYMRTILQPLISTWSFFSQKNSHSSLSSTSSTSTAVEYDPHSYSPLTHIISGSIAGGTAALITTPLDVTKTLLQTRASSTCPLIRSSSTLRHSMRIIYGREGMRGFWRGSSARVAGAMPAAAISWMTYEYFKWVLQGREYFEAKQCQVRQKRGQRDDEGVLVSSH